MMRLTQRSCSTLRGVSPVVMAAMKATTSATKLTVSWNCKNFRMLPKTERPHSTDLTMEEKLSSRMTMSAASLATSVPEQAPRNPVSGSSPSQSSAMPLHLSGACPILRLFHHERMQRNALMKDDGRHERGLTGNAHGKADIRLFEGGGIVGAIARDSHNLAQLLQQLHQHILVLR